MVDPRPMGVREFNRAGCSRHLSDIVFLAGVATRADLSEPLTARQAKRVVEALDRIGRPGTEVVRLRMAMERLLRGQPKPG